jgi:hypothetical protein
MLKSKQNHITWQCFYIKRPLAILASLHKSDPAVNALQALGLSA